MSTNSDFNSLGNAGLNTSTGANPIHQNTGVAQNSSGQGISHATDPNASKVPETVQQKVPKGVEDALPDSVHPTPPGNDAGKGVSHATGKSIVPQKLQEKLPEKVERAVPNFIHDTSDPVHGIKK
ncbi:hypothetical protein FKW77_002141 [Venturia effusa]|uniref:Uncharacterized protein n=1 Tax=Venturia effusa TaxID=50376 RepID=A0A517LAF5_9PEZI|nr:hypothetical protein FKW77_002141 [Venturia effusa]